MLIVYKDSITIMSLNTTKIDVSELDALLEKEKIRNKGEVWIKLDKTIRRQKLEEYAEKYGKKGLFKRYVKPASYFCNLDWWHAKEAFSSVPIHKWKPKWGLNHTLDKIIEWNKHLKKNNARNLCINQISDYLNK